MIRRLAGDGEGFRDFALVASPSLLRTAYLLLGDRDAAEDAVQTALLRTYRHWRRVGHRPDAYTWTVLVNVCRDQRRRLRRKPESLTEPSAFDQVALPSLSDAVVQRQDIEWALRNLPDQQREILVLRFYLDLSVPDTAAALGIAPGTVKSATSRALDRLRRSLSAEEDGEVPAVTDDPERGTDAE